MIKIKLFLLISFCILLSCRVNAEDVFYRDLFGKNNFIMINQSSKNVLLGDLQIKTEFCPQNSQYFCVDSEAFSFAVPRSSLHAENHWEINGKQYSITDQKTINIGGDTIDVYVIDSEFSDTRYRFLYSTTRGLFAFRAASENNARSYLLQGRCGIAAPVTCNNKSGGDIENS